MGSRNLELCPKKKAWPGNPSLRVCPWERRVGCHPEMQVAGMHPYLPTDGRGFLCNETGCIEASILPLSQGEGRESELVGSQG